MLDRITVKSVWNIAASQDHWKKPFKFKLQRINNAAPISYKLTKQQRITAVALAALVGLATFGIGGVGFFYTYTAYLKNREIKKLTLSLIPTPQSPNSHLAPSSPENQNADQPPASPKTPGIVQTLFENIKGLLRGDPLIPFGLTQLPIPPASAPLPLPPGDGVKTGILNLGATCWLNSALKFIATTAFYDGLFNVNIDELEAFGLVRPERAPILNELQAKLRQVIISLRTGQTGTLLNVELYKELVSAVDKFKPNDHVWDDQLDAAEFIRELQTGFFYPLDALMSPANATEEIRKKYPQILAHYRTLNPGVLKYAKVENFTSQLTVALPAEEYRLPGPLDIPKRYALGGVRTVRHDFILGDNVQLAPDPNNEGQPFVEERALINAPETLIINFERNRLEVDRVTNEAMRIKCERPISFEPGDTMNFLEYDVNTVTLDEHRRGTQAKAKTLCTYQVEAAICHSGSAYGGHYTAYELAEDGTVRFHNDTSANTTTHDQARHGWQNATMLRLRLINRTPIPPGQAADTGECGSC